MPSQQMVIIMPDSPLDSDWISYKMLVLQNLQDMRADVKTLYEKIDSQTKEVITHADNQEKALLQRIDYLQGKVSELEKKIANIYSIGAGFSLAGGVVLMLVQYIWTKFFPGG